MVQCRFTASPSGRAFFWGERWTLSTVGCESCSPSCRTRGALPTRLNEMVSGRVGWIRIRLTACPSGRAFFWGERWTPSIAGLRELQPRLSNARGVAHAVKRDTVQ